MEAVTQRSRPPKKKPLSDRTNFTVPTSAVLRKLTSSLSSPPRFSNSNPKLKPYDSICLPRKPEVDCSKSDTSIGSSNFNVNDANPSPVTQLIHSTPPRAPLTEFGNGGDDIVEPVYRWKRSPEKRKNFREAISAPLTCSSTEKTRIEGKLKAIPTNILSAEETTKDTRKVIAMPIGCASLVNTKNKQKENVEPLSCPPLPRTRKRRTGSNEDAKISHSYTAPHPKHRKKRRRLLRGGDDSVHGLPSEFIEKQRAYFKEVDEFELPEEEVSGTSD